VPGGSVTGGGAVGCVRVVATRGLDEVVVAVGRLVVVVCGCVLDVGAVGGIVDVSISSVIASDCAGEGSGVVTSLVGVIPLPISPAARLAPNTTAACLRFAIRSFPTDPFMSPTAAITRPTVPASIRKSPSARPRSQSG